MALLTPEDEAGLAIVHAAQEDLYGTDSGKQWDATKTLGQSHGSRLVLLRGAEVLSEALARKELEPGIRWNAAEQIATLSEAAGNTAAFALATALLQRKPGQVASDAYVRTGLADCLGRMGSAARGSGAVSLCRALQDDRDVRVRRRAAMALGQLAGYAGAAGAQALARALRVDKDLQVRCRCAEAMGGVQPQEAEARSLIEGLAIHEGPDLRWRCAMSLGKLPTVVGKEGAAALRQAQSDLTVAVREHAMRAQLLGAETCLRVLEELVHPYVRGQALWFLGSISAQPSATEALVAALRREDVYLRRRAVEALGCQGAEMGSLGALSVKLALEDPDVYIQWRAFEIWTQLPPSLQGLAETEEAAELLRELETKDAARQEELRRKRVGQAIPRWEPEPEEVVVVEVPVEEERQRPSPLLTPMSKSKESGPSLPPSPVVPPHMEAWENSPMSPKEPIEAEAEVLKSFLDPERTRDIFRTFAEGGEMNRDDLYEALLMLGHQTVNTQWVHDIIKDKFSDRNFLDAYDFSKFLAEYEACHMNYVRLKFAEADVDGSGRVDAEELAEVLRRAGITPVTGVVEQLLLEVCGRAMEVTFTLFAKILGILRYRLGFTLQEYSEIMSAFRREDRAGLGKLNLLEARLCLDWLGFDISMEELQPIALELKVSTEEQEPSLNDFDFVRLVRAVREREAQQVHERLRRSVAEGEEVAVPTAKLPELLSDLNVTLASPDVVMEAIEALHLKKPSLSMEDIMPVLWHVRRYQGLSQAELDVARSQFEACDEDGSGGMACCELEFAIRSLGFPVTYEEVQEQLDLWDMDESGEIEFVEFLKIISHYKKKELQQVLQAMFSGEMVLQQGRRLSKAGRLKRGKSELPAVLLSSGHCPLRQDSGVLQQSEEEEQELNLWGFSNLISEYRREINEDVRRNHGWTLAQVEELRATFSNYDPERTGQIEKRQLRRLLLEQCPQAEKSQEGREQIAQMVKESDIDGSGAIEFQEFLKLMRLVSNRWSREKLAKERAAVSMTKFSVRELKEFRKVFKTYARPDGEMQIEELQQMLSTVTRAASGAKGSAHLQEVLRRYSHADEKLDFPDFLHVMRHLLDENWGEIKEAQ